MSLDREVLLQAVEMAASRRCRLRHPPGGAASVRTAVQTMPSDNVAQKLTVGSAVRQS